MSMPSRTFGQVSSVAVAVEIRWRSHKEPLKLGVQIIFRDGSSDSETWPQCGADGDC